MFAISAGLLNIMYIDVNMMTQLQNSMLLCTTRLLLTLSPELGRGMFLFRFLVTQETAAVWLLSAEAASLPVKYADTINFVCIVPSCGELNSPQPGNCKIQ